MIPLDSYEQLRFQSQVPTGHRKKGSRLQARWNFRWALHRSLSRKDQLDEAASDDDSNADFLASDDVTSIIKTGKVTLIQYRILGYPWIPYLRDFQVTRFRRKAHCSEDENYLTWTAPCAVVRTTTAGTRPSCPRRDGYPPEPRQKSSWRHGHVILFLCTWSMDLLVMWV